jgi:nicotinamide mononucleotide transporter
MTSLLEIAANLVTAASILLAARNSAHTWWTGIIGCALFALLFYTAKLYADVVLQGFFILTSVIGWWAWLRGEGGRPLPTRHAEPATVAAAVLGGALAAPAYGALLHYFTDAYAPFIDSTVLVFSVIAQLLLMQRRVEAWLFWVLVNTIAVPLYASRELYLTAGLYLAYWVNAVVAWGAWSRRVNVELAGALPVGR